MMSQGRSRAGSAALWGVVCGLVLAALLVVSRFVLAGAARREILTPGRVLLSSAVALAVAAALYFVAGVLAGRRARALEPGLFAGLIAGLIVGVTVLVLTLLALASLRVPPDVTAGPRRAALGLARAAVARSALDILLQMAIGAGLGALGGLVGRGRGGSGAPQAAAPPNAPPLASYPPYTPPPGASPPPAPIYPAPGDTAPTMPSQP